MDLIDWETITKLDVWLDDNVAVKYKEQPMAQDLARIAKLTEEAGEAIDEFILWTGQNPRKGENSAAYLDMLLELADCFVTSLLAIQHFTKDIEATKRIINSKIEFLKERIS